MYVPIPISYKNEVLILPLFSNISSISERGSPAWKRWEALAESINCPWVSFHHRTMNAQNQGTNNHLEELFMFSILWYNSEWCFLSSTEDLNLWARQRIHLNWGCPDGETLSLAVWNTHLLHINTVQGIIASCCLAVTVGVWRLGCRRMYQHGSGMRIRLSHCGTVTKLTENSETAHSEQKKVLKRRKSSYSTNLVK